MTVILKYLLLYCINSIYFIWWEWRRLQDIYIRLSVSVSPVSLILLTIMQLIKHEKLLRPHSVQNTFQVKNCHKNTLHSYYINFTFLVVVTTTNIHFIFRILTLLNTSFFKLFALNVSFISCMRVQFYYEVKTRQDPREITWIIKTTNNKNDEKNSSRTTGWQEMQDVML